MFKSNCGKLMVYASTGFPGRKRLISVRTAAQETAKRLKLDFEVIKLERAASPIYVYTKRQVTTSLFRCIVMRAKYRI
jgi:hypothetical protein